MKRTHGGKRKGAGRKPMPVSKRMSRHTITLRPSDIEFLCETRDDNLSLAIRRLIEQVSARLDIS